jgi:hypothetical protein
MKALLRTFFVGCLIVSLTACAVGNRHRYHNIVAEIQMTSTIAVAVTTHDQREYIVSGQKSRDFVGLQRGGYGNPFSVTTDSGNALADDMTRSLVNSLARKGFKTVLISVAPADDRQTVINKLKSSGTERFLILTLTEWKSDSYVNTALIFDIKAEVLDRDGKTLGKRELKGRDNLGGSVLNPPAHAMEAVPAAFKEKIEKLLNSQEIVATFQ